jgi:hypothetical protein
MEHYINQEASLLANTSKKTFLSIVVLSILLATAYTAKASTIDNQKIIQKINSCKAITVNYLEKGIINVGDTDQLAFNLSIEAQKTKAKQLVIDSKKSEMTNIKGNCNIHIYL